jgi:hypothetical protein
MSPISFAWDWFWQESKCISCEANWQTGARFWMQDAMTGGWHVIKR